jgi:N-terminal acetyltransferase B complex non-catalytic subunit
MRSRGRNWTDILAFIDSTFSLLPPAPSTEENPDVVDMLSVLNAACTNDLASERGAHLAVLEVIKRLGERKLPPQRSILESLGEYLELFGSKACCFEDLKPYVDSLSEAETVAWLALLQKKKDATTLVIIPLVSPYFVG